MKHTFNQANQNWEQALMRLRSVAERNPEKAQQGRIAYLAEVKEMLIEHSRGQAVSQTPFQRLKGRMHSIPIFSQRKERYPMFTTISTLVMVVALLFGGAGATVYAAQDSLPNQFLYPLKTLSEEVRFNLAGDPQSQAQLALSFAVQRMEELVAMIQQGKTPPEDLATQLQLRLDTALQLAASLKDAPMQQVLRQTRAAIQQMQRIADTLTSGNEQANTLLARVRETLNIQNRLCELGLEDPAQLRALFTNRNQMRPGSQPSGDQNSNNQQNSVGFGPTPNAGNGPGSGFGDCPGSNCAPVQDGSGSGPGPNNGSGSEGGSGSGAGSCVDCAPVQDVSGSGPGPNNGSGSEGGSGSATGGCVDCVPVQDGSGPGPGPNNGSGSEGGSGSGAGSCVDCAPVQNNASPGVGLNPDTATVCANVGGCGSGGKP